MGSSGIYPERDTEVGVVRLCVHSGHREYSFWKKAAAMRCRTPGSLILLIFVDGAPPSQGVEIEKEKGLQQDRLVVTTGERTGQPGSWQFSVQGVRCSITWNYQLSSWSQLHFPECFAGEPLPPGFQQRLGFWQQIAAVDAGRSARFFCSPTVVANVGLVSKLSVSGP